MRSLNKIAVDELARPFDLKCVLELISWDLFMFVWSSMYVGFNAGFSVLAAGFWAALGSEFTTNWFAHLAAGIISGTVVYILSRWIGTYCVEWLQEKFKKTKKRKKNER